MRRAWWGLVSLSMVSCLELGLPSPPPPPGPGTVQGTALYAVTGRTTAQPAKGARVQLLDSSLSAVADDEGRFLLSGLTSSDGVLRFTLDLDADGSPDRQRVMSLKSIGAGPGRDIALGDVSLGRNARVVGKVLRGDLVGDTFHLGTQVFVTGMEFATSTADNGSFSLDGLPEGPLQLAFFRENYLPDAREVTLASGEELRLTDVALKASPSAAATVTGTVQSTDGAPIAAARVRAVSSSGQQSVTTRDDGTFMLGPIPSGAWMMAIEATGFTSAALGRRLLVAGTNDLGVLRLSAGTSTPVPLDAGVPVDAGTLVDAGSPLDAGTDAGFVVDAGTDAGTDAGFDAGTPPVDAGFDAGLDAGTVDAGSIDAGTDAGSVIDAGTPTCGGLCAPGFLCGADNACHSSACGAQSCALCNQGQCFTDTCMTGGPACRPGDVCFANACTPLSCAGVTCSGGQACANGTCLPTSCGATQPCRSGFVCLLGACVDSRCVGRGCANDTLCVDGTCWPTGTPGNPCGPGFISVEGRCREAACEGVVCAAGTQCAKGQCVSGGLYVAGTSRPSNIPNQPNNRYFVGGIVNGRWQKLASFPLPIVQLALSADGAWLFLRTRANDVSTVYRSQDGRSWTIIWSSTLSSSGDVEDMHVDERTGTLSLSLIGMQVSSLHRVLSSTDNGNTWNLRFQSLAHLGVRSFAPPHYFTTRTPYLNVEQAVHRFYSPPLADGGTVAQLLPTLAADAYLISDRRGVGPTFLTHSSGSTYFLDGGMAGSFSVVQGGAVYGPAGIYLMTTTSIARSYDDGVTWSYRAPSVGTASFSSIARGADGNLYVANFNSNPPLLTTNDDGETWSTVPTRWAEAGLNAWWPEWVPNQSYGGYYLVQPSDLKATGYVYRLSTAGVSGATEPDWADGGAGPIIDGTAQWVRDSAPPEMLPTALVSRACTPGQLKCGTGCVDVATSAQHCGSCNQPCATTCTAGRCLSAGSSDGGLSVGCADGTREGFVDVTRYPDVAACAGSWTGDLDVSSSASALCATGWHVCTHADSEVRVTTAQATAFPGCFAFRASVDGYDGCESLDCSNDTSHDDVAAVGASCLSLSGVAAPSTDGGACFSDRGMAASQCCSVSVPGPGRPAGCPQRGESGVVCCR